MRTLILASSDRPRDLSEAGRNQHAQGTVWCWYSGQVQMEGTHSGYVQTRGKIACTDLLLPLQIN